MFRRCLWSNMWSKSPSWPGAAPAAATHPEGLFFMFRFGVLYLCRGWDARYFLGQAYQFLARLYKEYSLAGGGPNSPAQEPTKACGGAFHSMIVVVTRIQLEYRINPLALVKSMNLFCVLPDTSQKWVSSFALLVTQGKIHTIGTSLWLMGEDVLLHSWKPERARHAANPWKEIRPVDGIQRKQPGQRIPSDPTPARNSGTFLLCCGALHFWKQVGCPKAPYRGSSPNRWWPPVWTVGNQRPVQSHIPFALHWGRCWGR